MNTHRIALLVVALLLLALAVPAQAKGKDKLPKITGGGWATNDNTGGPEQDQQFGFNARATAADDGSLDGDQFDTAQVYEARGQWQGKTVDAQTGETLLQAHGEVVCLARLGTAEQTSADDSGPDTDEDPHNFVWEIRVGYETGDDPPSDMAYGSFYVQDDGRHKDFLDENFAEARLLDPRCNGTNQFDLEEVTRGQITVKD